MSEPDLDYAAIQQRVETNLARQKGLYRLLFFLLHGLFYGVSMAVIWGTALTNPQLRDALANPDSGASILVILPTILWAAVILFHAASLYFESSLGEKALRQRLLARAVSDALLRQEAQEEPVEKPKRRDALTEARYRLSAEDGEFILLDDDAQPREDSDPAPTRQAGSSVG